MKFSGYQRAVGLNAPQAPRVQAPRDEMAYGAGGKGLDAMAAAVGQVNKVVQKEQDDADAADVMEASNKIKTSLMGSLYGEDGLFTTGVGENARGLTDRTTQTIHDTTEDVLKGYNARVQKAVKAHLNDNMFNFQRNAAAQESKEREGVEQANYTSLLATNGQFIADGYANPDMINSMLTADTQLVRARGLKLGWSGEQLVAEERKVKTAAIAGAVNRAIAEGDEDTADKLLNQYRSDIDAATWSQLAGGVKKKLNAKNMLADARAIATKYVDADGNFNQAEAEKDVAAKYGPNAKKWVEGTAGNISYSGNATTDNYINTAAKEYDVDPLLVAAIASAESGYNQDATSDVGARGVMQLMPDTAAGLGVNPDNPADNIRGGAKYIKQMLDMFGGNVELALAAYNAGPQTVKDAGNQIPNKSETQAYVPKVLAIYNELKSKQGKGYDIANKTYYTVKPGVENEVVGLNNNTWTKLQQLSALYENEFAGKEDYEPIYVTAAAAQGGHNTGSAHYNGAAFDIAMDSLKRHPERFKWLEDTAKKLGLKPLNEYNGYGNEEYAKGGENFHFSDDGTAYRNDAIPQGTAGHWENAYDEQKYTDLLNMVKSIAGDKTRAIKTQRQAYLDNLSDNIKNVGSYSAAITMIKGANLKTDEELTLRNRAASFYNINQSTGQPKGSKNGGGSNKTSKNNLRGLAFNLDAGKNITGDEILKSRAEIPLETMALIDIPERQGIVADKIDELGLQGAYRWLLEEDGNPELAAAEIAIANDAYFDKRYQGDKGDE